ncbi:MAG: glycerate kinase [Coriobacteriales bacterium]|nr:glycerate kinase [Coriobacteriales bacterium]
MRFLFASDSFKGTISSARAAELLSDAARAAFPLAQLHALEVADGGEGTVDAVVSAVGGTLRVAEVRGPRGDMIKARYGLLDGNRAIIEMAAASGLPLLSPRQRDPRKTSTWGTGELIAHALDQGVRELSLAIGGSATNDAGMGCMSALGARFLDAQGRELTGVGSDLARVEHIDLSGMDDRLSQTRVMVMCDVDNPLLGPRGATRVFGPQKGATQEVVEELEAGMAHFAEVLASTLPQFDAMAAGAGAAGGLGGALQAFLGARLVPGIEHVLDLVGFDELLVGCDLCVTGEGHADAQSAHGKVISGVAARCRAAGVPCVAVVGGMDADALELHDCGVYALVPTVIDASSIKDVLAHAERNYAMAARRLFDLLKLGSQL